MQAVNPAFYFMWSGVQEIHAARRSPSGGFYVTILSRGMKDDEAAMRWRGDASIDGSGTRENPIRTPAADVSPCFGVFEIWFLAHGWKRDAEKPIFIEVNDYLFAVTPEGVISEDDRFTRLLS